MQVICRLLELPDTIARELHANHARLPEAITSSKAYSDVYRYWHAIEYQLLQHAPSSPAARWLSLGTAVSAPSGDVPGARLVSPTDVAELDRLIQAIAPEDLAGHYGAAAMDAAGVYPQTWQEWEETFDPLGQVLEHYSFLQFRARACAEAGHALLLVFEELAEGEV